MHSSACGTTNKVMWCNRCAETSRKYTPSKLCQGKYVVLMLLFVCLFVCFLLDKKDPGKHIYNKYLMNFNFYLVLLPLQFFN